MSRIFINKTNVGKSAHVDKTARLFLAAAFFIAAYGAFSGPSPVAAAQVPRLPAPGIFFADVKTSEKIIALTFDDGPGEFTRRILDMLAAARAKATFFVEGSQLRRGSAILKRICAEGHEIGNHTYSHINFYSYKKDDRAAVLENEITKTDREITDITGVKPRFLRMPHGYSAAWVREVARRTGHVLVNWSFGCDWMGKTENETSALYVANVRPGAIILMHDGGKNRHKTVAALNALLEHAAKEGYKIVTVGELIGGQGGNRTHTRP